MLVTQFPDVDVRSLLWCVGVSQSGPHPEVAVVGFYVTVPITNSCLLLTTQGDDHTKCNKEEFPQGSMILIP